MGKNREPTPVPKLWEGSTCFILGGGPSLNDVDFDLIKDRHIIAVNNAYGDPVLNEAKEAIRDTKGNPIYTPRDWVDIVWFGDGRWYDWHYNNLKMFSGIVAHCAPRHAGREGVLYLKRTKASGIDTKSSQVAWNKTSGGSAINFAYHLGVKRIVLLGFDMRRVPIKTKDGKIIDKPNWHEDHPNPDKNDYWSFIKPFPQIAEEIKALGVDVINCTPDSAIKEFPIMTLKEYLKKEKKENGKKENIQEGSSSDN